MDHIATVAFAFLVGLTLCGIAGSLLELSAGEKLSFAAPFFRRLHWLSFVLAVITAGPFMLLNDAVDARKAGTLTATGLIGCGLTVTIWATAIGIFLSAIAIRVLH
jgi:hypothetical protein